MSRSLRIDEGSYCGWLYSFPFLVRR